MGSFVLYLLLQGFDDTDISIQLSWLVFRTISEYPALRELKTIEMSSNETYFPGGCLKDSKFESRVAEVPGERKKAHRKLCYVSFPLGNMGKGALIKRVKTCKCRAGTAEFREGNVQTRSADNTPQKRP